MSLRGLFQLIPLLALGCGEGLVHADYRGEPILRLEGVLTSFGPGSPNIHDAEILVSLFWNTDPSVVPPKLMEQASVSTELRFPRAFEIRVFEPPLETHFLESDPRVALGLILLYADRDGNGAFGVGSDTVVGGNLGTGLVYAREEVAAADSPIRVAIPSGFSLHELRGEQCAGPGPRPDEGPGGDGRRPIIRCSEDSQCPRALICDQEFAICVPERQFEVTIGGDFDLSRPICGP